MTGFKTRNILCVPVKDVSNDNRVVAVIEAINKNPGDYDAQVIGYYGQCVVWQSLQIVLGYW